MSEDCVFLTVAGPEQWGARHEGPTPCARLRGGLAGFPDAQWRNGRHWVCGEHGVSESTFTGTAADGSRVEADMVDVFTFKNGKIQVKNAYRKQRPALRRARLSGPPDTAEPKHGRSHGCADECPHGRFDAGPRRPGLMTRPTIRWCRRRGRAGLRPPTGLPPPGRRRRTTARSMRHGGGRGRGRSGFTGLSAALTLARDYGVRAVVLEANRAVWGCTSRNGGQGQNASGRLYRSQWIQRWGLDTARRLDAEIREGFEYWKSLVAQVDCDAQPGGHLYTAHRQKKMAFLENEPRHARVFGYDTRMLSRTSCASATWTTTRPWARCWSRTAWACIRSSWPTATCARRARWARASIRPARCWAGAQNGAYLLQTPAARCARGAWPSPPAATRRRA